MGDLFSDLQGSKGYKDKTKRSARNSRSDASGEKSGGLSVVDPSGVDPALLPASLSDVALLLPQWVDTWCENNMVQDIRKASAQIFRALCMYIGKHIKHSKILKDDQRESVGAMETNCNRLNPVAILELYDTFVSFCAACDKIPFGSDYAAFCGVSASYMKEYGEFLTSKGFGLRQKTHAMEIDAIRRRTSYFPVGGLAILNNELYSGGISSGGSASVTVEAIPTSAGFKAIDEKPLT